MNLESTLGKFMEKQVLRRLLAQENVEEILAGQCRRVTCMFCDVCSFTSLAEWTNPRELFSLLNHYLGEVIDVVSLHDGTIDKMIGDAIMVLFGAPLDQSDQEERAVRCAIDIQHKVAAVRGSGIPGTPLHLSITINTGDVSAGCLGNDRRLDYTVLGDPVNVAARMQDLASADQILIGQETHRNLPPAFERRPIGSPALKGRATREEIFEVAVA